MRKVRGDFCGSAPPAAKVNKNNNRKKINKRAESLAAALVAGGDTLPEGRIMIHDWAGMRWDFFIS